MYRTSIPLPTIVLYCIVLCKSFCHTLKIPLPTVVLYCIVQVLLPHFKCCYQTALWLSFGALLYAGASLCLCCVGNLHETACFLCEKKYLITFSHSAIVYTVYLYWLFLCLYCINETLMKMCRSESCLWEVVMQNCVSRYWRFHGVAGLSAVGGV
jgi:hypothetical protein